MGQKRASKWAISSGVISIIAVMLLLFSGYGYQWEWWGLATAFKFLIPISVFLAILALALAVIFVFAEKNRRRKGMAVTGALLSILVLVFIGYWFVQGQQSPPIHDITTDIQNPPQFVKIGALRAEGSNPLEYGGPEVADIQQKYYPDIQTLYLDIPYPRAFKRALSAALKMPWEGIVSYSEETGLIEATDERAWFGFKGDIVIRVDTAQVKGQSKIDVRSVSRLGRGDLGANADRVREYLQAVKGSDEG
ncbi:MAG TPA: DUF1499 domain-containing protein [Balneolaceae bacterium]|nr:DUF1499 domain-containing protein [Balneolaceae bacterium]